jgi:hypothetical protein
VLCQPSRGKAWLILKTEKVGFIFVLVGICGRCILFSEIVSFRPLPPSDLDHPDVSVRYKGVETDATSQDSALIGSWALSAADVSA